LFSTKDPLPCVKLVSFTDRKEPFQIVSSYADPSALPAGDSAQITKIVVGGFPNLGDLVDQHPKIKVEFNLDLHGMFTVVKAQLLEKLPVEEKKEDAKEGDGKSMDTSEDSKEGEKKEAKDAKPKTKKKRTPLTFTVTSLSVGEKLRQTWFERECAMSNQDRVIAETSKARDMLERYVLEMRGRLDSKEDLGKYITDADKAVFQGKLAEEDDWLMTDEGYEAKKSEYNAKLKKLMKYGTPVCVRKKENEQRKGAVDMVKKMVNHYQFFAISTDEKYSHITAEQKATVTKKCNEIDQWISVELTKQERLPLTADPSLTKADLIKKAKELDGVCKPIANTPKPKPPPAEKKEEAAATDGKTDGKTAESTEQPKQAEPAAEAESAQADQAQPMQE